MIFPIEISKHDKLCFVMCEDCLGMYEGIKIMTRLKVFCDKFDNKLSLVGDFDDEARTIIIHSMYTNPENGKLLTPPDSFSDICEILGVRYKVVADGSVHFGSPVEMFADRNAVVAGRMSEENFISNVRNSF